MKVAVSATGQSLESQVDPRFGRCQYFLIIDTDTMAFEAIQNASAGAMSGAGIQAAQAIAEKGVKVLIAGNVGPNAHQVLSSAGIRIMTGASGTVREAVESFKRGLLQEATGAGGMRVGMGGAGTGRGMGRGMGRSSAAIFPQAMTNPWTPAAPMSSEQEISMLEAQMNYLQQQLERIRKRLDELRGSSSRDG